MNGREILELIEEIARLKKQAEEMLTKGQQYINLGLELVRQMNKAIDELVIKCPEFLKTLKGLNKDD